MGTLQRHHQRTGNGAGNHSSALAWDLVGHEIFRVAFGLCERTLGLGFEIPARYFLLLYPSCGTHPRLFYREAYHANGESRGPGLAESDTGSGFRGDVI